MLNKEIVSVIVPIYKVEAYLERCLSSIVNQTYDKLQIILVDDGSPDNCGNICDKWANKDKRIIVVHKKNEGLGNARNSGLDVACGEYVVFIDSDDYINELYIETLVTQMNLHNADLVVGGFVRKFFCGQEIENPVSSKIEVIEKENIVERILLPVIGAEPSAHNDVEREMSVCLNIYRKSVIDSFELRFLSERDFVSEDLFFNLLYFTHTKKAVIIPECMYYYSYNANSLTNSYRANRFEKYCEMLRHQQEILKKIGLYQKAKNRLFRTFLMKTKKSIALVASSKLSVKEKVRECKGILNNALLQEVAQEYGKNNEIAKKQKFFVWCVKYHQSLLLLFIYTCLYMRRR